MKNKMILSLARHILLCLPLFGIIGTIITFVQVGDAQVSQGAIAGNIQDSTGALLPNAQVTITNTETGVTRKSTSNNAGSFHVPNLNIGDYKITASLQGFKTAEIEHIKVFVGTTTSVPVTLELGNVSETVTVQADSLAVNTEASEVAGVITAQQALDLPLNLNGSVVSGMRSPEAFVFLLPGTAGPGTANGQGGTWESKINGGQNYATEILLDGASMYRSENGSSFDETAPSVEAIAEFKVSISSVPAESGRTTGGIESFNTKGGTNQYHGKVYELFKNRVLNANNWGRNLYRSRATTDADRKQWGREPDEKNDYGLTLGGPVHLPKIYDGHDKTFFFFSWEQYRKNTGVTSNQTVPTVAERTGDFSARLTSTVKEAANPCDGTPVYAGQIFDPRTTKTLSNGTICRTAFPGNKINLSSFAIDSATQKIIDNISSYYPAPTNSSLTNNFVTTLSYPTIDTTYTFRIDQNISDRQRFFFTYSSRDNERKSVDPWLPNAAGEGRDQSFVTHYIRFGHDYTFSAALLNHLTLGYNRTNSGNYDTGVTSGKDWNSLLGISGASGKNFPYFYIAGYASLGGTVDGDAIDNGYRVNDTVTWIKGRHSLKFGVDYRYQVFTPITHSQESGRLDFNLLTTAADVNSNGVTGNGFASMLLGMPGYAALSAYASQPKWLASYYALFLQDSFKVIPSLTLNYGLRWDVDVPRREAHDNTSNLSLTAANPGADGLPGALVFAGKGTGRTGKTGERWADTWFKDFGPRVGFVWSPSSRNNTFSIAGGYGILYAALQYADYGGAMRQGFETDPTWVSSNGLNQVFPLATGFPSYTKPPVYNSALSNFGGYPSDAYISGSHGRPAMIQNYSLELQQQIVPDLIFSMAYVGSRGRHLRSTFDATNSISLDKFGMGSLLNKTVTSTEAKAAGVKVPFSAFPSTFTVGQALRPYPQFYAINTDCCLENRGSSDYNSMQLSLQRRSRNGMTLQVSYTWSKTMTNADSAVPYFSSSNGGGQIQNVFNTRAERFISNQDLTNNFVMGYTYELPFGKNKHFLSKGGITDVLAGGWQIGGIQRYMSGQPISFYGATGVPGYDGAIRYQRVPGQNLLSKWARSGKFNPALQPATWGGTDIYDATTNPDPYRYFNYGALTDPNTTDAVAKRGSYSFGNMARTTDEIRTNSYLSEDFSIIKRTRITERLSFRFEVDLIDAFNRHIFNRANSGGPNDLTNFGYLDPTAMVVGPRQGQVLAKFEF